MNVCVFVNGKIPPAPRNAPFHLIFSGNQQDQLQHYGNVNEIPLHRQRCGKTIKISIKPLPSVQNTLTSQQNIANPPSHLPQRCCQNDHLPRRVTIQPLCHRISANRSYQPLPIHRIQLVHDINPSHYHYAYRPHQPRINIPPILQANTPTAHVIKVKKIEPCTICFDDKPKKPVACIFCRQAIGCENCVKKWFLASDLNPQITSTRNHKSCPLCRALWLGFPQVVPVIKKDETPQKSQYSATKIIK
uniref:RING-type domain-containing protein n=1 Tax=Panagrolaimus davidi TaxID=227884 RepID=A0A914QV24_9BILA